LGGISGAMNTEHPTNGGAVALDAAMGAGLGYVGDRVGKAVGAVVAPKINPLVQKLLDAGVKLTPGQTVGGMAHRLEDALRSVYGIGDMIIGAQSDAQKSLNRAAAQQVVTPLGLTIPKDVPEGHAQVKWVGDTLSHAYDTVLNSIPGVRMDAQFGQKVGQLRQMVTGLPADQQHVFESFIQKDLKHVFSTPYSPASGRQMKTLDELLGQQVRDLRSSSNPYDRQLSRAFAELQAETKDMLGRQYPQHRQTIDALNQGWASLTRLEPAAAAAKGGVPTPEQLRSAVIQGDKTMRHRASARGQALGQDLADAAAQKMNPTMGDSGTPARALATGIAGAALFSKNLGGLQINPWAAAALGAMGLPYAGKTAGNVTRAILTKRPVGAAAVRQVIEKARPVAAIAAGQEPGRER
jgi:hypothetical protein